MVNTLRQRQEHCAGTHDSESCGLLNEYNLDYLRNYIADCEVIFMRNIQQNRRRMYVANHAPEIEFEDDDFNDCLHRFLREQRTHRGNSEHTIADYRAKLTNFMHTLEDMRLETRLRAIDGAFIDGEYIRYLADERRLKRASIAGYLRALRAFFNWAVDKRIIERSPMERVIIGDPKSAPIETFSRSDLQALFSQPDPKLFVGLRDLTIMSVFLDSGIRVRELCDIEVDDVRFDDNQILIVGKNGENRLVPFESDTRRLLKRYIDARGRSYVDNLFITVDDEPMNRDSVRRRIAIYGRQANITDKRCSPHTFRHTFAKMSVQNGANIFELQAILGHKSLDMVRRYVNLFGNDVKDAHSRFSPMRSLRMRF